MERWKMFSQCVSVKKLLAHKGFHTGMDHRGFSNGENNNIIDFTGIARKAGDYISCTQVTLSAALLLLDGQ